MMRRDNKPIFLLPECIPQETMNGKFRDGDHIYDALAQILTKTDATVRRVSLNPASGLEVPSDSTDIRIGVLWYCTTNKRDSFGKDALALVQAGCEGLLIVKADGIDDCEIPLRESPLLCAYKNCIRICCAEIKSFLDAATGFSRNHNEHEKALMASMKDKLQQVVAYYVVFYPIGAATGHGAHNDIANRLLAPIRILSKKRDVAKIITAWNDEEHKKCWANFTQQLKGFDNCNKVKQLRNDLKYASDCFEDVLNEKRSNEASRESDVAKIGDTAEGLMTLLTEYRRNAGIVTNVESPINHPTQEARPGKVYRLLVVDDHCVDWKPVFECVKSDIEDQVRGKLEIVYSCDGKLVKFHKKDVSGELYDVPIISAAFQCDAVLLDIMIGSENGLKVLANIREYSESIPVILWTTTRSQEITNQAQLANGVILKKTCNVESFVATLAHWLRVGRNRRNVSLLNPFFDSVIKKPEYREYARNVSEWALKWMDGFHATSKTFRNFTDHGGRHFTRVLGFVERMVQPLLDEKNMDGKWVFAHPVAGERQVPEEAERRKAEQDREQDFLALYLAVFLHELGMLRIMTDADKDKGQEEYYVRCVRALHAPRGMLLLDGEDADKRGLWSDKEATKALDNLHDSAKIRKKIAVLVGYHARCFDSMEETDFLVYEKAVSKKRQEQIEKSSQFGMFGWSDCTKDLFESCVSRLYKAFSDEERGRLRFMAAILRVCDAIDKDASRNPPAYLAECGAFIFTTPVQDRETLKQMVCERVEIKEGNITFEMYVRPPTANLVNNILEVIPGPQEANGGAYRCCDTDFRDLWSATNPGGFEAVSNKLRYWNDRLENWLDAVWQIIHGTDLGDSANQVTAATREMLQKGEYLVSGKLNIEGVGILASISALFAGTEVLDEYVAIKQVGLCEKIRLGMFQWACEDEEGLKKHKNKVSQVMMAICQAKAEYSHGKRD